MPCSSPTRLETDWQPEERVLFKPCPLEPLRAIKNVDKIVVWLGVQEWHVCTVLKVDKRKTLPVLAMFDDGPASFDVDPVLYGTTGGRVWALLL